MCKITKDEFAVNELTGKKGGAEKLLKKTATEKNSGDTKMLEKFIQNTVK